MKDDVEEASALQLLAAVRHPISEELIRRLDVANKILPWLKWIGGGLIAGALAFAHVEYRLAQIGENASGIREIRATQDTIKTDISVLKIWRDGMQLAKNGYDINVVPRIALWDQTSQDWKAFSSGADSDLVHLREMYWMKQHGLLEGPQLKRP